MYCAYCGRRFASPGHVSGVSQKLKKQGFDPAKLKSGYGGPVSLDAYDIGSGALPSQYAPNKPEPDSPHPGGQYVPKKPEPDSLPHPGGQIFPKKPEKDPHPGSQYVDPSETLPGGQYVDPSEPEVFQPPVVTTPEASETPLLPNYAPASDQLPLDPQPLVYTPPLQDQQTATKAGNGNVWIGLGLITLGLGIGAAYWKGSR